MKSNFFPLIKNKVKDIKNSNFSVIIGSSPSKGARSPALWNKVYKKMNLSCTMFPLDVEEKKLKLLINKLKLNKYFIGGSVTIPYKSKIIKFINSIDPAAKSIGSVNTIIKIKDNRLFGTNTDYYGCSSTLKKIKLKNKDKILIIGLGGAGKACFFSALNIYKNNSIYLFNRSYKQAEKFIKNFTAKNIKLIKSYDDLKKIKDIKLIINTTSVGFDSWFFRNKFYYNLKYFSPLSDLKKLKLVKSKNENEFVKKNLLLIKDNIIKSYKFFQNNKEAIVFDIIYNPQRTVLQNICLLFNKNIFNGLNMNLEQAVLGFSKVNNIGNLNKIRKLMF
jgi:shikimate dehydrogenase